MVVVLLIDDDFNESKLFECYLQLRFEADYRFFYAPDLSSAECLLSERRFCAVFLDNRLGPGVDFTRTIPKLAGLLGNAKLFLISADVRDASFCQLPAAVDQVIDKFELRQEIEAGLLD